MPPTDYHHAPRLPAGDSLDPASLFSVVPPRVELEIGPGRGGFIVDRLSSEPALAMIGLEIRYKWAAVLDERLRAIGLGERGRVFAEDARNALGRLKSGSLHAVFVHFPDPWWKKRHRKRLVITPPLVDEIARLLVVGGELFIQTDVADRADRYEAAVETCERLVPWGPAARTVENPYGARSPRERRVEADGLPVVRLRYRRSAA